MADYRDIGTTRERAGGLEKIFGLLQRPQLGIAEGAKRVFVDKGGVDDFLKGLGTGLAGKSKLSGFSDVLAAGSGRDAPTRLQSLLGFGLDVAADPLTYTTGGVTKGIGKEAALKEAVRTASTQGVPSTLFEDTVTRIARDLEEQSPSSYYVKFGGREVARSEGLAKAGDKLLESITKRPTLVRDATTGDVTKVMETRNLAKAFSRKAEQPGGLDRIVRLAEMNNAASFGKEIGALVDIGEGLTASDSRRIMEAMDTGQINSLKGIPAPKNEFGITDLSEYADLYRRTLDRWWDDEEALHLRDPKDKGVDYVPRYLSGNKKNIERGAKGEKALRVATPNAKTPSERVLASTLPFDQLERLGFEPNMDIRGVMAQRGAKHYSMVTRARMIADGIDHLKVDFNDSNKEWLYKHDYVPAAKINHSVARSDQFEKAFIPREAAEALDRVNRFFDDDQISSKVLRQFDSVLNEWKFLATATPQTRLRNLLSDFIMSAQNGVLPGKGYYSKAAKVIRGREAENIYEVLNPGKAFPNTEKIDIAGNAVPARDVWKIFSETGGKAGFVSSELYRDLAPYRKGVIADAYTRYRNEDLPEGLVKGLDKARSGYGKFKEKTGSWADKQEDFMRVAHFTKALEDELPKNFKGFYDNHGAIKPEVIEAANRANDTVRKYNLDYGNLTEFEKKFAKRVVPFYSFMRQAIPQQVEMLFTKPGFMALYPKGTNLLSGMLGGEGAVDDPLVPEWMRMLSPFQVAADKQRNKLAAGILGTLAGGSGQGPYLGTLAGSPAEVLNRTTPVVNTLDAVTEGRLPSLQETLGTQGGAFQQLAGAVNPIVKSGMELGTGKNAFTGQDISDQGWKDWLVNQLPQTRIGYQGFAQAENPGLLKLLGGDVRPLTTGMRKGEAKRQKDELTEEYQRHSRLTPNGERIPTDARGRTLKKQISTLQSFISKGTTAPKRKQVTIG